ncbi:MAG: PAS domain-containing sensor histidine kinase [Spirosoma sp.]|nr:PAS domain-containing sensor histidine kinase [Spirosoma sp.]
MLTNLPHTSLLTDLLFTQSNDFLGLYNVADECFVRVNEAGARLLGFPSETALLADAVWSRSLQSHPLTEAERAGWLAQVQQTGCHEQTIEMNRVSGKSFRGQLKISSFNDQDYLLVLIRILDQDRLHRAEQELQQSRQRYEAVFANATIGIVVSDRQGCIVSVNEMARHLFGYAEGELTGQSIDLLVPVSVAGYHERLRQSFVEYPSVRAMGHNRDLHARRRDGTVFPVEVSLSYFRMDEQLYVVAYIIDITIKKEAEKQLLAHRDAIERLNTDLEQKVADRTHALLNTLEQLEQSKNELAVALDAERELGELKSRFVSMASHEFRTPLTAVLTSATLIEKYPDTSQQDKRQRHLGRIRASVNHLNDILEEFLSLGRLEEGRIEAHPARVVLADLVAEAIDDVRGMLKPGQTINTDLNCPAPVWLDPSLLRKILVNLLSNALKYSGPNQSVSVRSICEDNQLTLSVEDRGIGISADDQEHLFERFFRAKNANNMPGTGLGLHIVTKYAELLGGTVSLTSALDEGTTVTVSIPVALD